jgi:hypothetical protein
VRRYIEERTAASRDARRKITLEYIAELVGRRNSRDYGV